MSIARAQTLNPALTLSPAFQWLRTQGAATVDGLAHVGRAIWRGLAAHGQQPARHEMLMMSDQWQRDNPKLARELRAYALGASTY